MGSAIAAAAIWAIQNGPALIKLGMDVAPLISVGKDAVEALVEGHHVPPEQAEALRANVAALEAAWAEQVSKAQAEQQLQQ